MSESKRQELRPAAQTQGELVHNPNDVDEAAKLTEPAFWPVKEANETTS